MRIMLVCGHKKQELDRTTAEITARQVFNQHPIAVQSSVPFQSSAQLLQLCIQRGIPQFVEPTQP